MSQHILEEANYRAFREAGLLLHTCCGPCSEYSVKSLLVEGVKPLIYYFNPNIHPEREWQHRYEALAWLCDQRGLTLLSDPSYAQPSWEVLGEDPNRCRFCYAVRLRESARKAAELAVPYFTTTLLISPYQERDLILELGEQYAVEYERIFWAADWRNHFWEGEHMARQQGIYQQKYCGCIQSLKNSKFRKKIEKSQVDFTPQVSTPQPRLQTYVSSDYGL